MSNHLIPSIEENDLPGSSTDLVWFLKGFIYPIWSRVYYREASQKRVITALLFLCLFAFVQTSITTIKVAWNMSKFGREIEVSYEEGEMPHIVIENGIATASGSGEFIYEQNRQIVGVATNGQMETIDTRYYSEGFLLTQTDLHILNEDGYQTFPLISLNETFGNPIILDAEHVLGIWNKFSIIIDLVVLVGAFLWHSVIRFFYTAILGLLIWGVISLKNKNFPFGKILITGIYANIPTIYLVFVLNQININFLFLHTIILIIIWSIAIQAVLKPDNFDSSITYPPQASSPPELN